MREIISVLAILVFKISFSQSLEDNLLIYYPFSNNANDDSGNGFDGIVNATLTTDKFGNPNEAYSFNGLDEYIDFPNLPELKPNLPVSFSFFMKLDNLNPENTVLFTTDFAQDNHSGVWMNVSSSGYIAVSYGDASGNTTSYNRRTKIGTTPLRINTWYHILAIINGSTDMKLYVNCNDEGGFYQGSGGDLGYTVNSGSIGRKDANTNLPAYYLKGVLDDFRYWDRVLSLNEVHTLCNDSNLSTIEPEILTNTNKVSIYPNPTKGIIRIQTDAIYKSLFVYNILGQKVYSRNYNSIINIEHLNSGVYFLKIINNENKLITYKKIIKK